MLIWNLRTVLVNVHIKLHWRKESYSYEKLLNHSRNVCLWGICFVGMLFYLNRDVHNHPELLLPMPGMQVVHIRKLSSHNCAVLDYSWYLYLEVWNIRSPVLIMKCTMMATTAKFFMSLAATTLSWVSPAIGHWSPKSGVAADNFLNIFSEDWRRRLWYSGQMSPFVGRFNVAIRNIRRKGRRHVGEVYVLTSLRPIRLGSMLILEGRLQPDHIKASNFWSYCRKW